MNTREKIYKKYKKRLYLRYLGISLIPFLFFVLLGSVAVFFSQKYVTAELSHLSFRNLHQVRDTFELILSETDAFALGLATNPGFNQTARNLLERRIQTIEDTIVYRSFMSSLVTGLQVRGYIDSLYIYNKFVPEMLIANPGGILEISKFHDTEWLTAVETKKDEMRFWLARRAIPLFPSSSLSRQVITLYRNILQPYTLESQGILVVNIKQDYIESILHSISNRGDQEFIVFHPSVGTLVNTSTKWQPEKDILPFLKSRPDRSDSIQDTFFIQKDGFPYALTYLASERYPLLYLSLVSKSAYFHLSNQLLRLTVILSSLALVLGFVLILYGTRRSFRNIEYICDTMEAAEKGFPVSGVTHRIKRDSFYELTHEIVKTFLERNYLQLREKTLELQALQSQMNPHFLFNTLTSISLQAIGYTGGENDVTKMVTLLSRILDYSMDTTTKEVTLKDEMQFTQYYVEIQSYRYPDRFKTEWDIENAALNCRVIKLLLQPLVENAIYHGANSSGKNLTIQIRGLLQNGYVRILVEDNGVGMTKERYQEVIRMLEESSPMDHIGLINTVRRLKLVFGERVQASIKSDWGSGTKVEFWIPLLP